jgi:hypothetical protein
MIATSADIRNAIRHIWPDVDLLWLPDGTYERLPIDDLIDILLTSDVDSLPRRGEVFDCDDYALLANAHIKRKQLDMVIDHPVAFGEAFASKLKGREMNHSLNIAYCPDGLWMIEPQGWAHWMADKERDHVHTVKM